MKKVFTKSKTAFAFAFGLIIFGTWLNSHAFASTTPTLKEIKEAETAYINAGNYSAYNLTEITGSSVVPANAIKVKINNKNYYYTPNTTDDIVVLKNLASTGGMALVPNNTKPLYKIGAQGYSYNTDKLPTSSYSLNSVSSTGENTITIYEKDADGIITPKYYEVKLEKTTYGDTSKTGEKFFGWVKNASNNLEFKENPSTPYGDTKITAKYNNTTNTGRLTSFTSGADVNGNWVGNSTSGTIVEGGAIVNNKTIGDITGDFVENSVVSTNSNVYGGAIYNNRGVIDSISGNFIGNYSESTNGSAQGGAIQTWYSSIGNITGDFIGNYVNSTNNYAYGGVIHNINSTIGNIEGDFIGNYAKSTKNNTYGGAIYNNGVFKDITGNFIGNYAENTSGYTYAGAIYNGNNMEMGNLTGDFIGNYAKSTNSYAFGGAILNNSYGEMGSLTGDFIGNYAISTKGDVRAGAIYNNNDAIIDDITGNFIENHATTSTGNTEGGAIYNFQGKIGNITGDFTGNYITTESSTAYGGAVHNSFGAKIGDIKGSFLNNYAKGAYESHGGAIYNSRSKLGNIEGSFSGNYAKSADSSAYGGAIFNSENNSEIGNIQGNFENNYIEASVNAVGGAIYNKHDSKIGNIIGNFTGNYVKSLNGSIYGGAILNSDSSEIGNITGNFIGNYASGAKDAQGGAIHNNYGAKIGNIAGDFTGNHAESLNEYAYGGAIHNNSIIGEITGNFVNNYAKGENKAHGGAIYSGSSSTINIKNSIFENNATISSTTEDALGGSIYNSWGTINLENVSFAQAGTITIDGVDYAAKNDIYNLGKITATGENYFGSEITNSGTFSADGKNYFGSKITNSNNFTVTGENYFNGEIVNSNTFKADGTNTFAGIIQNTGTMDISGNNYFGSEINGTSSTQGKLNFASGSNVTFTAPVVNQNISLDNTTINLVRGSKLDNTNLAVLSVSTLNAQNGAIDTMSISQLDGDLNMTADLDLAAGKVDNFTGNTAIAPTGTINIESFNLIGTDGADNFDLQIADGEVKGKVKTNLKSHLGRIYNYDIDYDETTGLLSFRGGGSDSAGFNPAVLAAPVAAQLGGYAVQLNSYDEAFRNVDMYMLSPRAQRQASKFANRYAGNNLGALDAANTPYTNNSAWFRPYTIFENVPLKNGPKVSNTMYGTFMGTDSKIYELGRGWDGMLSGYIGYNGSHQSYDGIGIYQNGGTLGAMGALYKGNFFTALTVNAGANAGRANTSYGKEDFTMLMGGVASKTGYNFELADGKFIIQPSYLMSYSFVNTLDYTSASGLNIDSKLLNAIQIEPAVKFIGNLKNGWQPYAGVSFVWNIMDKAKFTANDAALPELSVKPYVKYGAGVKKSWGEKFSGFVQAYLTHGGRNGVGLHAGFTWYLGKSKKK